MHCAADAHGLVGELEFAAKVVLHADEQPRHGSRGWNARAALEVIGYRRGGVAVGERGGPAVALFDGLQHASGRIVFYCIVFKALVLPAGAHAVGVFEFGEAIALAGVGRPGAVGLFAESAALVHAACNQGQINIGTGYGSIGHAVSDHALGIVVRPTAGG